ncbi:tpr repeat-containing protein [Chrysochromulina tobinii]|uniref:Tpr repeat-containing protein n=1 Tax=Chrysochromulina tobinii TaxID=1460289 RepID=A0A0M0JBQ2_9EUKA|nr:tpr repeat-containing protein [Chrysochromulina tobinii]|eukprot:KOO23986.1 tpr repeat-containing protein [Chrysochromulina sp. CCMP291]
MMRVRGGMGAGASALSVESPDADIKAAYEGASAQERSVFLINAGEQEKMNIVSLGLFVPEATAPSGLTPGASSPSESPTLGTREWAFAEILKWLDDPASPQLFWLMGGGGAGKTVRTAELLDRVIHRAVAWHFCRHDNPTQSAPGSLLRSRAAMLAHRLPGYKEKLEATGVPGEAVDDPSELFTVLFETPLLVSKVQAPEMPLHKPLLAVIASQLSRLPSWLKLFVTSRAEPQITRALSSFIPKELLAYEAKNRADVEKPMEISKAIDANVREKEAGIEVLTLKNKYASPTPMGYSDFNSCAGVVLSDGTRYVCEIQLNHIEMLAAKNGTTVDAGDFIVGRLSTSSLDAAVEALSAKAEGLFLYAYMLGQHLESEAKNGHEIHFENLDSLPAGLGEGQVDPAWTEAKPLVELIAAAREPITVSMAAALLRWDDRQQRSITEGSSIREPSAEFKEQRKDGHAMLAEGFIAWRRTATPTDGGAPDEMATFWLRHGILHLCRADGQGAKVSFAAQAAHVYATDLALLRERIDRGLLSIVAKDYLELRGVDGVDLTDVFLPPSLPPSQMATLLTPLVLSIYSISSWLSASFKKMKLPEPQTMRGELHHCRALVTLQHVHARWGC